MPDYQKGKIYKLVGNGKIYIGSTVQLLCNRKWMHLKDYKNNKKITSKEIIEDPNHYIELIENFPCNSKEELFARERYWIENTECVNKNIPCRTQKEYYDTYRAEILESKKQYREINRELLANKQKQYYKDNKEQILAKDKQRYDANAEQRVIYARQYREANKEKLVERRKENYEVNKAKFAEQRKRYYEANKAKIAERNKRNYEKRKLNIISSNNK